MPTPDEIYNVVDDGDKLVKASALDAAFQTYHQLYLNDKASIIVPEIITAAEITTLIENLRNVRTVAYEPNATTATGTMDIDIVHIGDAYTVKSCLYTVPAFAFSSWNTLIDGTGISHAAADTIAISDDITLYAQWTRTHYIVSYDANGGTGEMSDDLVTIGNSTSAASNTFTPPEGYEFSGWNTAVDGTGTAYATAASITPSGDITFYAQWTEVNNG